MRDRVSRHTYGDFDERPVGQLDRPLSRAEVSVESCHSLGVMMTLNCEPDKWMLNTPLECGLTKLLLLLCEYR